MYTCTLELLRALLNTYYTVYIAFLSFLHSLVYIKLSRLI